MSDTFNARVDEPTTFNLPVMNAMAGFCSPDRILRNTCSEAIKVTSASSSPTRAPASSNIREPSSVITNLAVPCNVPATLGDKFSMNS